MVKMKRIISYIAISLNGKIARADGRVDWLDAVPNPDNTDFGYYDFYDSIDVTIQGNSTYQQIIGWDLEFPYKEKRNYVITRNTSLEDTEYITFISKDHIEEIKKLKEEEGKDIWLIGGGKVNALLMDHGLVDEIRIHIMPIVIPDGLDLFIGLDNDHRLELKESKVYNNGVMEIHYDVKNPEQDSA